MYTPDEKFINNLKNKDNKAYMQLFDLYFERLHRFAFNLINDSEEAKDIVQNVFISIYENPDKIKSDFNLASWLIVSVRNRCLNYLRDLKVEVKHKTRMFEAYEESNNLEYFDDTELLRKINTIIQTMPEKCREICELRFYRNMKVDEIAQYLSITPGTVKTQIHRAISNIKKSLATDDSILLLFYLLF